MTTGGRKNIDDRATPLPLNDRPTAVYRFYDADGRLLYVGITVDIAIRWAWHQSNSPWWGSIARHSVTWCGNRSLAASQERRAIQVENPVHNTYGRGRGATTSDRHLGRRVTVRPPEDVKMLAQSALQGEGWELNEFFVSCLALVSTEPKEFLSHLESHRPLRKRGRPKSQRS